MQLELNKTTFLSSLSSGGSGGGENIREETLENSGALSHNVEKASHCVDVDFYESAGSLLVDFGGDVEETIEAKPSCLVSFDRKGKLSAIELLFENNEHLDERLGNCL